MDDKKNTRRLQIETMPAPEILRVPLHQHIGLPCEPLVKPGDKVERGQMIGDVTEGLGCAVHSAVSGVVKAIEEIDSTAGGRVKTIIIENDGENRLHESVVPFDKKLTETTTEEIVGVVKRAGIAGLGGAAFPTHFKISSAAGRAKRLIVNCAECEPYITANHRLLLENPAAVINGIKILLKAFGLRNADIAVENNKLDAVNKLEETLAGSELMQVKILKTKYPQGDERQLVYALSGVEIPEGKLPADVGFVIFNPETCAAIYRAFAEGMPLVERIVTVDGDCIKNPKNVIVPTGTPFKDIIEFCGGLRRKPDKIVTGGPMMGVAQWDINAPAVKATSALLVLSKRMTKEYSQPPACIHCGKCVAVCQMRLLPTYFATFAQAGRIDLCEKYNVMSCVECGACSYICPGNVPIVQYNRVAKAKITADRRTAKAALEASSVKGADNKKQ